MIKSANVQKPLKKGKANFMLIGEAKVNEYTFKIDNEYDSAWIDNQLNLGIDCGNGNVVYTEMRGGYSGKNDNVIYVHGIKEDANGKKLDDFDNRFTIDWDDRFDETILETVGNNCFVTVGIEKDAKGKTFIKKYLSAYDAVAYVQEHLTEGMVLNVKGNLTYSEYNESINVKKEITSIFLSKVEKSNDYKATFNQTLLIDYNSIGKKNDEKGTIEIRAYVIDYVGKVDIDGVKTKIGKMVSHPKNFELQINDENPEITAKMLSKFFKVAKKTDLYELTVEGDIIEGRSIVNVTDADIPADIKELIEMGIYTEDEAKVKCAVGDSSREKRLVIRRPTITYAGNGENRKPLVALDVKKYKESDKVFLGQLIAALEITSNDTNEEKEEPPFEPDSTNEEEDLLAMLNNL